MDEASERLKKLIAKFVLRYNYWGYLFSRLKRKPYIMNSIMGVAPESDGTISLLYNPEMMKNTDDENLSKVIEHEGLHLLNHHVSRLMRIILNEPNENMKLYKTDVWNIAADCTVNTQGDFPKFLMINEKKWPLCFPDQYGLQPDQITEKYYLDLLKQNEKENKKQNKKQNEKEQNKKVKGKGKGKNKKQKNKQDQDQEDTMSIKPNIGSHTKWMEGCKNVADLSALEKKIQNYVKRIIKDSIKTFSKDRGKIPGYISDLIQNALTPPQLPYYQIIKKLVRGSRYSKFKRTPTRINRKRTYSFVFAENKSLPQISPFPGRVRDFTFDVVIVIDTSGSMRIDDIKEGLSGVRNIIEKDRYCKTTVLEVDTQIAKEYECKNIKDIQFNVKGRGGTTLGPGLFRAKQLHCDVCLVFTDGFIENVEEYPKRKLPKKIIWIVNKKGAVRNLNKTGFVVKIP